MGIEFVEVSAERLVATMPVEGNTQPYGLLHGGASVVLAETLGSWGAMLSAGEGRIAVGVDINATHHRSARDRPGDRGRDAGLLRAHAGLLRGRRHRRRGPPGLHLPHHVPAARRRPRRVSRAARPRRPTPPPALSLSSAPGRSSTSAPSCSAGTVGLLLGARLPERVRLVAMDALGLGTLSIAVLSVLDVTAPELADAVGPGAALVVIGSALLGGILGALLRVEDRLERLGHAAAPAAAARAGPTTARRAARRPAGAAPTGERRPGPARTARPASSRASSPPRSCSASGR